jgi:hypothetical protein
VLLPASSALAVARPTAHASASSSPHMRDWRLHTPNQGKSASSPLGPPKIWAASSARRLVAPRPTPRGLRTLTQDHDRASSRYGDTPTAPGRFPVRGTVGCGQRRVPGAAAAQAAGRVTAAGAGTERPTGCSPAPAAGAPALARRRPPSRSGLEPVAKYHDRPNGRDIDYVVSRPAGQVVAPGPPDKIGYAGSN